MSISILAAKRAASHNVMPQIDLLEVLECLEEAHFLFNQLKGKDCWCGSKDNLHSEACMRTQMWVRRVSV
jgi:hypothetical protein